MEFCKNQNSMDQLSDHSPKIMKHPLYHQKSVPWLDLRVFYIRISNIKVDDATPEKLKLVHTPVEPDTILEVNGRRSIAYSKSVTFQLRRDRVDKKHEEATFVNTDSVKMKGSVRFELYDGDELMLSGKLESYDDRGFTGEAKEKGKRWKIRCQSHISKAKLWDCSEMILPTIEVYAAGCFSGSPIILTKTLQFGLSGKIDRKMILDSIWDYESSDLNKNEPLDFVENSGLNKLQHTDDYNQKKSYYETSDYMEDDDDDGELSWFNAGVRVGVGIGLGVCVGVGLGVGLLVRLAVMLSGDIPPSQTIYIKNLNEKVKKEELKRSLYALFSQYGRILDVVALKTLKLRGQAWVVFSEVTAASAAVRQMQNFPFYDKPMRIQYAKEKSDCVAKADGTFVAKEKRKKQEEKAEKKRKTEETHPNGAFNGPSAQGAQQPFHRAGTQGPPAAPNNILFIENLPNETTSMMLQILFQQYPGFREVRMIEAKPGIAFVEFEDDSESTIAMQALQGFKITPQNPMSITYAKK